MIRKWLLAREKKKKSKEAAKERLQRILIQDRMNFGDKEFFALKTDLLKTAQRYFEIDRNRAEITLKQEGHSLAVTANLPMKQKRAI